MGTLVCPLCETSITTGSKLVGGDDFVALGYHLLKHHPQIVERTPTKLTCTACGYETERRSHFARHWHERSLDHEHTLQAILRAL